jgi:hypothetical protein
MTDHRKAKSAGSTPAPFATPAQSLPSEKCLNSGSERQKVKPRSGGVPRRAKSASSSSAALLATTAPAAVGEKLATAAGQSVHSDTKPHEVKGGEPARNPTAQPKGGRFLA